LSTSLHKSGIHGTVGQSIPRVVFVCAMIAAVLSTAWFVGRETIFRRPPDLAERYRGLVMMARDGQCERFELDNQTGFMWPKGVEPCDATATVLPPESSGPRDRLHGIIDHFKSR